MPGDGSLRGTPSPRCRADGCPASTATAWGSLLAFHVKRSARQAAQLIGAGEAFSASASPAASMARTALAPVPPTVAREPAPQPRALRGWRTSAMARPLIPPCASTTFGWRFSGWRLAGRILRPPTISGDGQEPEAGNSSARRKRERAVAGSDEEGQRNPGMSRPRRRGTAATPSISPVGSAFHVNAAARRGHGDHGGALLMSEARPGPLISRGSRVQEVALRSSWSGNRSW